MLTGNFDTNGALNIDSNSVIDFRPSDPGAVVSVNDLSGNGNFIFETDIVNQVSDKLVVNGTATGDHKVQIVNEGSSATTGDEKMTIVEAVNGTAATFTLAHTVELGAWKYEIAKLTDNNGEQYWELYAPHAVDPSDNSSNSGSAAANTLIAGYLLNYAETDTLMKRLGDLRDNPLRNGAWFRVYGGKFDSDARNYAKAFDMTYGGVQAGYDRQLDSGWLKNGKTYVGAFIGFSNADVDFTFSGSGKVENRTMGMYATYIGDSGFYLDGVAKYTWSKNKFDAYDSANTHVDGGNANSGGLGFSLEGGKRFRGATNDKGGRWYVEPQLQLSYQHMDGATFRASNGLAFGVESYKSLLGRAGFLLGYETAMTNFYAKASYVREFDGDMDMHANGVAIFESMDDHWFTYGIGVTHQMNERNSLYFDVERTTGGEFEQKWRLNGGWRISF